jgi:hypothetical protein
MAIALVLARALFTQWPAIAEGPTLAIDAGSGGNSSDSVGEIEDCVSVDAGDQFKVDIIIMDITDLLAWEVSLDYDPEVLTVIGHDVKLFQAANPGSAPIDISSKTPDTSGFHTLSAFESSDPPAVDSGSGVLARVTLEAIAKGESKLRFGNRDLNQDGKQDRGTLLRDVSAAIIGDETGDDFFDGETQDALAVVGSDCPPGSKVAVASGGDPSDGGSAPWLVIGGAAAATVVLAGGITAAVLSRRRSAVTRHITEA